MRFQDRIFYLLKKYEEPLKKTEEEEFIEKIMDLDEHGPLHHPIRPLTFT